MLQRHLQDTYEYLFDTAHRALLEGASFAPFGAGIRKTGEQIHTNVDLPMERSAPTDHISGRKLGALALQSSSNRRCGSSRHSLTRTRKVTASRPSMMRWS